MIAQITIFLVDILIINLAFITAFFVRYGYPFPEVNFIPYKENFAFLTFIYMLAFAYSRLFKKRFSSLWELFEKSFLAMFLGTLFGIALVYVFRLKWLSFPSSVFLISFPIGLILVVLVNGSILRLFGNIKKKIIVVGNQDQLQDIVANKYVEKKQVEKVEDILKYGDIDEVVICERIQEDKQLNLLIYLLLKLKVNVVFSPAIYAELLSENMIEENSIRFLTTFIGRKSDHEEFLIRAFDVMCSIVILMILAPLLMIIALAIKLSTNGSVLYKQKRVAKDGCLFTLYKFKTMINNAEENTGPVLAKKDDKRVTKIGRLLRTTRLDEIPQLGNVILGQMSLVGPRPERPFFVKQHKALRQLRLAVKPGLTGFAQIRSLYDLHPKHKIKYDYLYIQQRSLRLNIYILAKTIPVILSKKGW